MVQSFKDILEFVENKLKLCKIKTLSKSPIVLKWTAILWLHPKNASRSTSVSLCTIANSHNEVFRNILTRKLNIYIIKAEQ